MCVHTYIYIYIYDAGGILIYNNTKKGSVCLSYIPLVLLFSS